MEGAGSGSRPRLAGDRQVRINRFLGVSKIGQGGPPRGLGGLGMSDRAGGGNRGPGGPRREGGPPAREPAARPRRRRPGTATSVRQAGGRARPATPRRRPLRAGPSRRASRSFGPITRKGSRSGRPASPRRRATPCGSRLQGCRDNLWVHAALGRIALESSNDPTLAKGHFGYAFELARKALPPDFAGKLPRDRAANRPFYDAIDGLIACHEALGRRRTRRA